MTVTDPAVTQADAGHAFFARASFAGLVLSRRTTLAVILFHARADVLRFFMCACAVIGLSSARRMFLRLKRNSPEPQRSR